MKDGDSESKPKLSRDRVFELMFTKTAIWQMVFLLGAALLVSLWNLDAVRRLALEQLGPDQLSRAEAALEDPDDEVATHACYLLLVEGEGFIPAPLERTLYERPYVAAACLERVSETIAARREDGRDEPERAWRHNPFVEQEYELVPRHELLASTLGRMWMTDLFEGTQNACPTALNARRALEHARLDPTYRLMSCAVAADSPEVRDCCVKQLGGHEVFAELLEQPERAPLLEASFDFAALAGASFPSVPLAASHPGQRSFANSTPKQDQAQAKPASAPSPDGDEERFSDMQPDVQDWVVEVGCNLHLGAPERQTTAEALVPLVESPGCAPTEVAWSGMHSATSWSKMCLGMYEYRRRELAYSPRESICDSLAAATVSQTITVAGFDVAAALSQARQTPGVRREELDLVGDSFGDRLYGHARGEPTDEHEEPESQWKDDENTNPLDAF